MWQRFTDKAKRAVFFAQEEAGRLGETYVSTEHLLLGLIREDCTARRVLERMQVDFGQIRSEVEKLVAKQEGSPGADMQLTPRAKRVIDVAYDEARRNGDDSICTQHILLGILREGEGLAARILGKLGIGLERTREVIAGLPESEMEIPRASTDRPDAGGRGETPAWRRFERNAEERLAACVPNTEAAAAMAGKDLIEIGRLSRAKIQAVFQATDLLKYKWLPDRQRRLLQGRTLVMIFEKPSLRTRVTFETGIFQLGGHGIYLQPSDIQLGVRETIADAARNLARWADIIMARTFKHETVTQLAEYADVPVINGLSDLEHPCQALADFYTIFEKKGRFEGIKLAFVGDGNNVAHSLMLLAAKVGTHFSIACPEGYEPSAEVVSRALSFAEETGAEIQIVRDPREAVEDADVVYTDVWASMGQEHEAEERARVFAGYQVNAELMSAAKPDAIFEHCLPAHRGQEVTDEVIDGRWSAVIDEAENRLHVQKAVMALVAG